MKKNNLTKGLQKIVDILNTSKFWDFKNLEKSLTGINLPDEDILPYQLFDHDPKLSYGRNMIYDNGNFHIYAMSWLPGDGTSIHDHSHVEWGSVLFCGDFCHRVYNLKKGVLTLTEKDDVKRASVEIVKPYLIHAMTNLGDKPIISIHIYGTNTPKTNRYANIYQPEFQQKVKTTGAAYLNISEDDILAKGDMSAMSDEDYNDYISLITPFYERNKRLSLLKSNNNGLFKNIS